MAADLQAQLVEVAGEGARLAGKLSTLAQKPAPRCFPGRRGETIMRKAFQDIAQRLVNAEESFINSLMEYGGITRAEATRVFDLYRREKLIKRDAVGGVYNVKHGAFLDRDVIRRALAESPARSGGKRKHSPAKRRASTKRKRVKRHPAQRWPRGIARMSASQIADMLSGKVW